MASTGSKRHIHKYRKLENGLWVCSLADCTHYMPKNIPNGVMGKRSICFGCGETFILDTESMKMDLPECDKCRIKEETVLTDFLKEKGL